MSSEHQEHQEHHKILKGIKPNKIILPILIGLGFVVYMLINELNVERLQIKLLNVEKDKKAFDLSHNKNYDTVYCQCIDTTIFAKDTLILKFEYFVKNGKEAKQIIDTVYYFPEKAIFKYTKHNISSIYLKSGQQLNVIFDKPIENPISLVEITWKTILIIFLAWIMMFVRDFCYMLRIRILSDKQLKWKQCFNIIMLWEFTSAVTPTAVGGTSVAVFFLNKEGINVGRSTAIVMATALLDELYFILMTPLLFIFISGEKLFSISGQTAFSLSNEFILFALGGYLIIFAYTALISYAMFFNPRSFKYLLLKIFKLPFLKKWKTGANKAGDDLIQSSGEFKNKPFSFWLKSFGATFFSWTARYLIVNFLLLAFVKVDDHLLIFGRQLIMWIMMLISPTPGGSGFSEFIFKEYLGEYIPSIALAVILALIWRLITYYPYLFVGAFLLPRWLKNKLSKKSHQIS